MPKIIKRLRNFGYRVPFLRRRFELEDILLVGVAVGGSFAVVLGWILCVDWRILYRNGSASTLRMRTAARRWSRRLTASWTCTTRSEST